MFNETEFQLTDFDYQQLEAQASGIMIVHLNAVYLENDEWNTHSPIDYHLHILFFQSPESRTITALNLDSSDSITEPFITRGSQTKPRDLGRKLAEMFVDRVNSMIQIQKFDRDRLFFRSDSRLWAAFNRIKEETYTKSLERFTGYLRANRIEIADSRIGHSIKQSEPPINYNWAEIRFAEERFLEPIR